MSRCIRKSDVALRNPCTAVGDADGAKAGEPRREKILIPRGTTAISLVVLYCRRNILLSRLFHPSSRTCGIFTIAGFAEWMDQVVEIEIDCPLLTPRVLLCLSIQEEAGVFWQIVGRGSFFLW